MMESKMLLRNAEIFPSTDVLRNALGDNVYGILDSFFETITNRENGLNIEWRYYNDGKAWLGKITYKKKTILWLSVWEGFFKTSFYFTEKHLQAIAELDVSEEIKKDFGMKKPIGKLIPMIIDVSENNQLEDLVTIIRFKKNLK